MKTNPLTFATALTALGIAALCFDAGCTANTDGSEATSEDTDSLATKCTTTYNAQTRKYVQTCTPAKTSPAPTGTVVTKPAAPKPAPKPATPATPATPVGCNELTFGVSDYAPFATNSIFPVQGESDAEVNIFRSGYIQTSLDYGALLKYANPNYCASVEFSCLPNYNTFRTIKIAAGLGTSHVIRFALWATAKNNLSYTQVSTINPGTQPNANDIPVGGTGPYIFEMRNILSAAVITGIAKDTYRNYMLTAYVPDASQEDIYTNHVCDLRFDVDDRPFN